MALGFFFLNCKGAGVVTTTALYQGLAKFIKPYGQFNEDRDTEIRVDKWKCPCLSHGGAVEKSLHSECRFKQMTTFPKMIFSPEAVL